jgi:hypothetical protein
MYVGYVAGAFGAAINGYMSDVTGTTVTYTGGANIVAHGGWLLEEAAPGQTTPSPYVPTGAAPLSVYGRREYRQNLALWSEDQSNAVWLKQSATALANQGAASVGTYTKLTDTAANASHDITATLAAMFGSINPVAVGERATFVARLKAGTKTWALLFANNDADGVWFNLATGVVGSTTGNAVSAFTPIQTAPNEWLVGITFTMRSISTSARFLDIWMVNGNGGLNYLGDGTGTIFIAGVQVVQGAVGAPPDYIKTTSAPANSSGAPRSAS